MHGAELLVVAALSAGAALVTACDFDFERMIDQPYVEPYQASTLFDDGAAMRVPPPGTVPGDRPEVPPEVSDGAIAGRAITTIPIALDRAGLERGRDRFERFCAPCHGVAGDGVSEVAANMPLRPPPSLLTERVRALPPGHVYRVIRGGFGLMPSYAAPLAIEDRWRVVAYVQALQLARGVVLSELPAGVQAQARRRLP